MTKTSVEPASTPAEHPNLRELVSDAEDCLWEAVDYVGAAMQILEGRGPISADRRSSIIRLIGATKDKMETVGAAWKELHTATSGDVGDKNDPDKPGPARGSTAANEAAIDATIARRERGEHEPRDMACEMENPIEAIGDYAEILLCIGADSDLDATYSAAVTRVARDLKKAAGEVEEWRGKLWHALHPRRGEPGFLDDGNGEVEADDEQEK